MLRFFALLTVLVTFIGFSMPNAHASQWDSVIEMAITQMKESGELAEAAKCVKSSESEFLKKYRVILGNCLDKFGFGEASDDAMNQCFESQLAEQFGLSQSEIDACEKRLSDKEEAEEMAEAEKYANASPEELQQMLKQEQADTEKQIEVLQKVSREVSKGTEGKITLPIYPNSTIEAHYQNGIEMDGQRTLPVATFTTQDDMKEVVKYYQQQLSGFQSKKMTDTMVVFMQEIPEGFDMLKDMTSYQKTPHVTVYSFDGQSDSTKNMPVTIEITYKK